MRSVTPQRGATQCACAASRSVLEEVTSTPFVHVRAYAELNDHAPPGARGRRRRIEIAAGASVGDAIDAAGIPRAEVEIVIVDGESVGFDHRLRRDDAIGVFPVFESFDVSPLLRVRARPLRDVRFVTAAGLEGLAARLRALGFDVLDGTAAGDGVADLSVRQRRVLLVRDLPGAATSAAPRLYRVRASSPQLQAEEVLARFDLEPSAQSPRRAVMTP